MCKPNLTDARIVSEARIVTLAQEPGSCADVLFVHIFVGLQRQAGVGAHCVVWPCGLHAAVPADPAEGPVWESALVELYRAGHPDSADEGGH